MNNPTKPCPQIKWISQKHFLPGSAGAKMDCLPSSPTECMRGRVSNSHSHNQRCPCMQVGHMEELLCSNGTSQHEGFLLLTGLQVTKEKQPKIISSLKQHRSSRRMKGLDSHSFFFFFFKKIKTSKRKIWTQLDQKNKLRKWKCFQFSNNRKGKAPFESLFASSIKTLLRNKERPW